jgi:paraquat-inducible protein B
MEIGASKKKQSAFQALANPPVVTRSEAGRSFVLKTVDLGSLDYGTPIFFRRFEVGRVSSYKLDKDGQAFSVQIFVHAPYDQYVNPQTRFWHASGIDLSLGANGLSVQTQSLLSILIGGIAFETPATAAVLPPADAETEFHLFASRADANKPVAHDPHSYLAVFKQSVRGLSVGAPVEFRGVSIGEVTEIRPQLDAKTLEFSVPVGVSVDPTVFGLAIVDQEPGIPGDHRTLMDSLVARGMRAQLKSGNLLTGALYVSVDFFPDAAPATIDWSQTPPVLPTVPGGFEGMEAHVASIIKKVDEMPIKAIGDDLAKALVELDATLGSAKRTLSSADQLIAPESPLSAGLDSTLGEVSRAARALRGLADYLERHPEALLRGKSGKAE